MFGVLWFSAVQGPLAASLCLEMTLRYKGEMSLFSMCGSAVAIVIGLSSCSQSPKASAHCDVSRFWNKTFETFEDNDTFFVLTVTEHSYEMLGYSFRDNDSFGKLLLDMKRKYQSPAQILVRSDASLSCGRLRESTEIIEQNYPCDKANICFSGYHLGEAFWPPNLARPPHDVSSR